VWPKPHQLPEAEIEAFVAGEDGNADSLVELLQKDSKRDDVPLNVREKLWHLADFLERKFRGKSGAKRTPSYKWSPDVEELLKAHKTMCMWMRFNGWTVGQAAETAAREYNLTNVTADALEHFHRRKYGNFNEQLGRKFRP
jgi:hypothetical protein